jgi:hypothetical protein
MTPKSYIDFFNHDKHTTHQTQLPGVAPYKLVKVKHPREGYKYTMEYNNFYTDWNKNALEYTSKNNINEFSFINNYTKNNNEPIILTNVNSKNIKLYKETKPQHEFARPMEINGSNKVTDLFDNCMNKKTFEYTRYSHISPHHKQWLENPIFTGDISKETQHLKNNYMNDMKQDSMDIYSGVFDDMYYLSNDTKKSYNKNQYKDYNYLNKIEQKINDQFKNNNTIENDSIQKTKKENIQKLDKKLDNRTNLRSEFIKTKKFYDYQYNYEYDSDNDYDNDDDNKIMPGNYDYLSNKLDTQLKNSSNLLSKDVKQYKE